MKRKISQIAAAALFFAGGADAARLTDQCVGGKWDELLAQSGIVESRARPELGLSEKLAFECPTFVNQVLFAGSLGTEAKGAVFSEVGRWPHDKTLVFYLKLRLENQKASEEFWGRKGGGKTGG